MTTSAPSGPPAHSAAPSGDIGQSDAWPSPSIGTELDGSATTAHGRADAGTEIAPLTDRLIAHLEARKLDVELMVMLGVGSSKRLGGDCIAIPYLENGIRVNTKYRTIGPTKKFAQDAGGRQILWNVDCLRAPELRDEPIVITEGEMDAFAALQCGFPRTVSVPGGAPMEAIGEDKGGKKYAFLDAAEDVLKDAKEIILAVDGDGPGSNLLSDLALRLGKSRCRWVRYPKDCKDLNDALKLYGEKGVTESLRRAAWYPVPGIHRMSELPPPDSAPALDIGIAGLGNHYRARRGDMVVVTGIPGHGKSSFINEVACRLAYRHGWNTCFASFEQSPVPDHRRALRSFYAGCAERDMTAEQTVSADAWIEKHFSFMVPSDDDDVSLEWVLERCTVAIKRFDSEVLVIDPWNEMDHERPKDMNQTEYTGWAIKQLKKFTRKNRVHLIVAAHPAKMQRSRDDGKYPTPSLYDIADSSHWANKPDIGIIVHRDDLGPKGTTTIKIAKVRYFGVIGEPGEIKGLRWNRETTRYELPDQPSGDLLDRDDDL